MNACALEPEHIERLTRHVSLEEIPDSDDLMSAADVEECLLREEHPGFDLLAAGDIMLGKRTLPFLETHGADYPFAAVRPLLGRSDLVVANLEGPLARLARKQDRRFSYRVDPDTAVALANAGIRVVTLANNHLVDCGRSGVTETLAVLAKAGITPVGAGHDCKGAHAPAVVQTRQGSIGVLGYYWNRRCAATDKHAGSAMDDSAALAEDIAALRPRVDLLFVTFHWGVPYEREPAQADREKARLAVDLGADVVIAHHPHVIQPFEIHRGRPIFFSVGNFAFGSGNTHAEGLLVGVRPHGQEIIVEVFPLYVKNRDPRVAYQPKLMRGGSAERVLRKLAVVSGDSGRQLEIHGWRGVLRLPRGGRR
jgi:hypothetical protein